MRFRNLDENGDWMYGKGVNDYVDLNQAIGLNIRTRVFSWLNDCFFAMTEGIDWNTRLGSKDQRILLENDLRRIISQSQDVRGIVAFSTSLVDRKFLATYTVETIYSKTYTDSVTFGG